MKVVTRKVAKEKGSQFEMSVEYSLQQKYPDCFRTHERGYVKGYDLHSVSARQTFECKRHRAMTWNEAKKYYDKLASRTLPGWECFLVFQNNRQPCLVMFKDVLGGYCVKEFEKAFLTPFLKHPSTKKEVNL